MLEEYDSDGSVGGIEDWNDGDTHVSGTMDFRVLQQLLVRAAGPIINT